MKKSLQLRMEEETIDMIKTDAKAMGMTPAAYVGMVCGMLNSAGKELATEQFTNALVNSVMRGYQKSMTAK